MKLRSNYPYSPFWYVTVMKQIDTERKTGILNACLYNFNRKIQAAIVHQQLMQDKVLV